MNQLERIHEAGKIPDIIFPVFTNGTYVDDEYFQLMDKCRNLVPVLSIEGGKEITDSRRGEGVYDKLTENMKRFNDRGLIFGASITVTTENYTEVTSDEYLDWLKKQGCRLVIFVEFVPVTDEAQYLAPGDEERQYIANRLEAVRSVSDEMVLLSFPGDELAIGGCMAAGREFFHINSHGGAEPCPFSPYSDINVKDTSLKEAIKSRLFASLRDNHVLEAKHEGGCVLFSERETVQAIVSGMHTSAE